MMLYQIIAGEIKDLLKGKPKGMREAEIVREMSENSDIYHILSIFSNNIFYDSKRDKNIPLPNYRIIPTIVGQILSRGADKKEDTAEFLQTGWLKQDESSYLPLGESMLYTLAK